jgi:hypothetical protein
MSLNVEVKGGAFGVEELNSATTLIQIQPRRLPHGTYVLHRAARSLQREVELLIMVEVWIEEMFGSD